MSPLQELKLFVQDLEQFSSQQSCLHDVEHLGGPQGTALLYLAKNGQTDVSIKMIENHLKISKSVTSHLIRRMEKNGFISIEQSQKDRRIKFVRLTDFGWKQADKMGDYIKQLHEKMLAGISPEELEAANRVFRRIRKNIIEEKTKGESHV